MVGGRSVYCIVVVITEAAAAVVIVTVVAVVLMVIVVVVFDEKPCYTSIQTQVVTDHLHKICCQACCCCSQQLLLMVMVFDEIPCYTRHSATSCNTLPLQDKLSTLLQYLLLFLLKGNVMQGNVMQGNVIQGNVMQGREVHLHAQGIQLQVATCLCKIH